MSDDTSTPEENQEAIEKLQERIRGFTRGPVFLDDPHAHADDAKRVEILRFWETMRGSK